VSDWSTIASLSTAGGTLVLALATFASVRSANRAARVAENAMLENLRPLLVPSRLEDPPEKIGFQDDHWVRVAGGHGSAEVSDGAIYLAMPLRNVGNGIAVLDRWDLCPERVEGDSGHNEPETFRRLTRDLYVASSDRGFWQGAMRDSSDEMFARTRAAIEDRTRIYVDLLYGDFDGGQRVISRFAFLPIGDDDWLVVSSRHWNLDRPQPR
jgi:hypothetical protein